jgi:hypothetical protein
VNRRQFLKYGAYGIAATALPARIGLGRQQSTLDTSTVTQAVIHPAFGIARVGNSPTDWYLGPEVSGPFHVPEDGYKDGAGRIKRQASRFRIYGLDESGQVVGELTAADAEIAWTVHLANSKAAWYDFDEPLDIPASEGLPPAPMMDAPEPLESERRNSSIDDRDQLVIDPGSRTIEGAGVNANGGDSDYAFDGGRFFNDDVTLGELRTDDAGRLLVFGGFGKSAPALPGLKVSTFANNDLWHDDTSDGPVDATVRIGDREIPVTGAWVVAAPPNYAPGIQSVVTMYDLMFEVATELEPDRRPERPSFTRQIYPLFERMVQNQWVNGGFLRDFGWASPGDFLAPDTLAMLASNADGHRFLRWQVYERFRNPNYLAMEDDHIPPYYGDGVALPGNNPRQWMAVLQIQYDWLGQWADGNFDADWPAEGLTYVDRLEDLPVADQPDALDRASLDDALGGPFHPGCEMTWPMRHAMMYGAPFRLRRRTEPEKDWGSVMTSKIALNPEGPLAASGPGDVTRWMAVPWQTDTSSCLSRYITQLDEFLPTFWPAHVPNDVLTEEDYRVVMDSSEDLADRQEAFKNRVKWLRGLPSSPGTSIERINDFVKEWGNVGIITPAPGPTDGAAFPDAFWVEQGYALPEPEPEAIGTPGATPDTLEAIGTPDTLSATPEALASPVT